MLLETRIPPPPPPPPPPVESTPAQASSDPLWQTPAPVPAVVAEPAPTVDPLPLAETPATPQLPFLSADPAYHPQLVAVQPFAATVSPASTTRGALDPLWQLTPATMPSTSAPPGLDPLWQVEAPVVSTTQPLALAPAAIADPSTLAQQIRGQTPQPIDQDMMALSAAVYDPTQVQVGGWTRVADNDLPPGISPALFDTPETGFKAGLYANGDQHVLAFAGSETDLVNQSARQDWIDDVVQGAGFTTGQYTQAGQLAQLVSNAYHGDVVMAGHSLGGGLAALAAATTGTPAITFNAAGVHDNTYAQFGIDPAAARATAENGEIRAYRIDGEFLTSVQEGVWGLSAAVPDAPGHAITLRDPAPPSVKPSWNPIEFGDSVENYVLDNLTTPFRLHTQDSLIAALEQQHPWAP